MGIEIKIDNLILHQYLYIMLNENIEKLIESIGPSNETEKWNQYNTFRKKAKLYPNNKTMQTFVDMINFLEKHKDEN